LHAILAARQSRRQSLNSPPPKESVISESLLREVTELTYAGARVVLDACVAKAAEMGVPQCVVVVDNGGHYLAFARMDGAKVLSTFTATQ